MVALEPLPTVQAALSILAGDDNPAVCEAIRLALKGAGHRCESANSPRDILSEAARGVYDLVLLDLNYTRDTTSGREGLELLEQIRRIDPNLPVLAMTAWGSIELAVEAMRRGAVDFVTKPWDNEVLLSAIERHAGTARRSVSELDIAARVQRNLFPSRIAPAKGLDVAAACVPAQRVGGDYYDFFDLDDGERALLLADVSGKGIAAALLMANLQALFRGQMKLLGEGAANLLRSVNRLFHASTAPEHYATAFFARYDPRGGMLRYVNCGHPAALVARAAGPVERLASTATVLGIFAEWDCEEAATRMGPGDVLLVYSDGVTEAEAGSGEEFGEARAAELLAGIRDRSAEEIARRMIEAARTHSGGSGADDITVIAGRAG